MSPKTIEEGLTRDQLSRLQTICFNELLNRGTTSQASDVCNRIFSNFTLSFDTLSDVRDRMKKVLLEEMESKVIVNKLIDEIFENYVKTENNKSTTSPSTTTTTTTPPIVLDNSKVDQVYSEFEIHCFWLNCRDLLRDTCISVDYHSTILESLKGIEMAQDSALRLRLENALSNPFSSGHEATHFADVVLLGDNPLHPTPIPFTNEKFTACNLIALRNACMKNMRIYGMSEIDLKIVADDQAFNYNQYGNLTYTNELRGRVYEVMLSLFSIGDLYRRERAMSFVDPLFGKDEHQPPSTTSATILSTSTTTTTTPVVTDDSTTDNKGSTQKKLYLVEMKELYLRCVDLLEELQTPEHYRKVILASFSLPTNALVVDRDIFRDQIRHQLEYNIPLQLNGYSELVIQNFMIDLFLPNEQLNTRVSNPCSMPYISAIANIGLRYRCRKLMEEMNFPEQSITETLKRVFTYKVKDGKLPSRKHVRDELYDRIVIMFLSSFPGSFKKQNRGMETAIALTEQLFGKDEEDEQTTSSTTTPDRISTTDDKGSDQEKQLDAVALNELYVRCVDLLEEFQIPKAYRELVQNVFKVGGVPVNQSSIYSEMQSLFDQMPIDTSGFTADVTKFFLYELFVPIENADRDHILDPYTETKVRALVNAVLRYRCAKMMKEYGFSQRQINETLKGVFTYYLRNGQLPTRIQIRDELYVWLVAILPGHNLHNNVVRLTEQLFGKDEKECDQSSPTIATTTTIPTIVTSASTNSTSHQEKLTDALSKDRLHELMDKCCAMLEELGTPREYRNLITATIDFVNPISERTLRARLEECFSRLPIDTSGFDEEQSYAFIANLIAGQQVKLPFTDKYFSALSMNALKLQCAAKLQPIGDTVGLGSGDVSWILDQSFIFQIVRKGEYPTRKHVRDELMKELNKKTLPIHAVFWKRLESDLFGKDKDEKLEISLLQSHAQKPNYDWWNERLNLTGASELKDVLQQSPPPPTTPSSTPDRMEVTLDSNELRRLYQKCKDMLEEFGTPIKWRNILLDAFPDDLSQPLTELELRIRLSKQFDRIPIVLATDLHMAGFVANLFNTQPITLPFSYEYISACLFDALRLQCASKLLAHGVPDQLVTKLINYVFRFEMEDGRLPRTRALDMFLCDMLRGCWGADDDTISRINKIMYELFAHHQMYHPPPQLPSDQTPIETTTTTIITIPDEMLYDPLIAEKEFDELKLKCRDMIEADLHAIRTGYGTTGIVQIFMDVFNKKQVTLPILLSELKARFQKMFKVYIDLGTVYTETIREQFYSDLFSHQPITLPYNLTYINPLLFRAFRSECKSLFAPYGGGQYEIPTEYRDWIINNVFTFKMENGDFPKRKFIRNRLQYLLAYSLPNWCRFDQEKVNKCMEKLFGEDKKECSVYSGHTERLYVPTPDEATSFEDANKRMKAYLTQPNPPVHPRPSLPDIDVAPFTTTKNGITSMFFGTTKTSESTTSVQPINDQVAPPLPPPIEIKKEEEQQTPTPSSDILVRNGLRDTCILYMNTREFKSCYLDLAANKLIIDFHPIKKRKI